MSFIPERRVVSIKDCNGNEVTKENFNYYLFSNKNELENKLMKLKIYYCLILINIYFENY